MKALFLTLLILLIQSSVMPFKSEDFRKCDSIGFCKRQRKVIHTNDPYQSTNLLKTETQISIKLSRLSSPSDIAELSLQYYANIGWRFRISDNSNRYSLPENDVILKGNLVPQSISVIERKGEYEFLVNNGDSLKVYTAPFKIELFDTNKQLIMAVNENNQLVLENGSVLEKEEFTLGSKSFSDTPKNGQRAIGLDFTFKNTLHAYGIPEHASSLNLKSTVGPNIESEPYRLYNLDVFEYDLDSTVALYGSIPFLHGHSSSHSSGLFWANPTETWIDIERRDVRILTFYKIGVYYLALDK
jgi:alpha 1,3-glucosidase